MFRDKSIKPIIAIVIALIAIAVAFCFPYIIFAYENSKLDGYGIHYSTKPVNINLGKLSLTDKLESMPEILGGDYCIPINNDSSDYKCVLTEDQVKKYALDAYITLFSSQDSIFRNEKDINEFRRELEEDEISSCEKYLMIKPESKDMFIAWGISFYWNSNSFEMIIDDETGFMLSAALNIYEEQFDYSQLPDIDSFGNNLGAYYGFSYYDYIQEKSEKFIYYDYLRFNKEHDTQKEIILPLSEAYNSQSTRELYFNYYKENSTYDVITEDVVRPESPSDLVPSDDIYQDTPDNTPSQDESLDEGADNESYVDYSFRNENKLDEHYEKHGKEMGYSDAEAYEDAASDVVNNPNALHKTEKEDGDDVYYIQDTNEFVVVSTDGYIRTYFNPDDGIDYYNRQ